MKFSFQGKLPRGAETAAAADYSKLKVQNDMKIPKSRPWSPSHHRMKKILLVATVLVGGMAFSQAGVNVSIGIGFPLPPLPGVIIRQPAPFCPAPVYVAPRFCPPRVVVPCPPVYYRSPYGHGYYKPGRGYGDWNRHGRGYSRDGRGYGHRH